MVSGVMAFFLFLFVYVVMKDIYCPYKMCTLNLRTLSKKNCNFYYHLVHKTETIHIEGLLKQFGHFRFSLLKRLYEML